MDAITNFSDQIRDNIKYNNIVSLTIVTDVATEPVSVADMKVHLKIDFSDDDTYINTLMKECREELEGELNIAFAPKTIKVGLRNELGFMSLPYGPVTTISSVTDYLGAAVTSGNYTINNGVLETSYTTTVYVQYVTGYTTLPNKYKRMLKERVAYKYFNRGDDKKENQNKIWLL